MQKVPLPAATMHSTPTRQSAAIANASVPAVWDSPDAGYWGRCWPPFWGHLLGRPVTRPEKTRGAAQELSVGRTRWVAIDGSEADVRLDGYVSRANSRHSSGMPLSGWVP